MSGGQSITSGQGTVTQDKVLSVAGIALASGAGTIVADAEDGIAISGSSATLALGTAVSGPIIFLRSRKVGGGSATAVLLGGSGVLSQGNIIQGFGKPAVGVLLSGSLGAFTKARSKALVGSFSTFASGSLIGQGSPALQAATISTNGDSVSIQFSQNVSTGAGGSGGVSLGMSGGASTATYSSGAGSNTLVYSLSRIIFGSETGTISYTQPGNGIEGTATGIDVPSVSGVTVSNGSNITQALSLAWNANPVGENVTNYRVYRGSVSGSYSLFATYGAVTSATIYVSSGVWYFALTAVNAYGESGFSNEIHN